MRVLFHIFSLGTAQTPVARKAPKNHAKWEFLVVQYIRARLKMYKEAKYNLHMIIFYGKGLLEGNFLIRRNLSQNIAKLLIGKAGYAFPTTILIINAEKHQICTS